MKNAASQDSSNKEKSHNETSENNLLLMYILQNRADEFIKIFESQNNRCSIGVYMIYRVAYANKILLGSSDWKDAFLPVVEKGRIENQRILDYLETIIRIPDSFYDDFKKYLKSFALYDDDYDFEIMLDTSLDLLVKRGYREIDCRLYEAGMKFNFSELERLLSIGADPHAKLSAEYSSEIASEKVVIKDNVITLYDEVCIQVCDCYDLDGICSSWRDGFNGKETMISNDLLRALFAGAGFQIIIDIINNNK